MLNHSGVDPARADPGLQRRILEHLENYVNGLEPGWWFRDECQIHRTRVRKTLLWIADQLRSQRATRPLILGDSSLIDWTMTAVGILPADALTFTDFDLRYPFPLPDSRFDLVIATEVIEHIKDHPNGDRAIHEFSGQKNVMAECARVLEPGGRLLLTTPNPCSRHALLRLTRYEQPFEWPPHVRELSLGELMNLVNHAGFKVLALETKDVYDHHPACPPVDELLKRLGATGLRDDTFFVIVQKPGA